MVNLSLNLKAFDIILAFFIFVSIAIIFSLWIGLFWLNSLLILAVSFTVTFFIFKKMKFHSNIPKPVYILALLAFLLSVYPDILIHPIYNSSADPAPTIGTLVIKDKLPTDYSPYTNVPYTYQIGFPLFAKIFFDIFPFIQPYNMTWLLAAIFVPLQLIFLFIATKNIFNSEKAGIWASILFIGSRTIFQNIYVGEYPWILATTFFLATLATFFSKNKLAYIFFPVVFILNPSVAFYSSIFLLFYLMFNRSELKRVFYMAVSVAISIPAILITYIPVISNTFQIATSGTYYNSNILAFLIVIPPWIGLVPFAAFIAVLFYLLKNKNILAEKNKFFLSLLAASVAIYIISSVGANPIIAPRIVEFATFVLIMFVSSNLAINNFGGKEKYLKAAVILLSIAVFLMSTQLNHLRDGSKISQYESAFASKFKQFDPLLEKTLFLVKSDSKMAEYSNKIPFGIERLSHFISVSDFIVVKGPQLEEFENRTSAKKEIIKNRCIECIYKIGVKYVVVDPSFIDISLNESPIFTYNNILVYNLAG